MPNNHVPSQLIYDINPLITENIITTNTELNVPNCLCEEFFQDKLKSKQQLKLYIEANAATEYKQVKIGTSAEINREG